jgi:hypothetical protein
MHKEVTIFAVSCFSHEIASCRLMFGQVSYEISLFPLVWFLVTHCVVLFILNPREAKLTKMHSLHEVYHAIYIEIISENILLLGVS